MPLGHQAVADAVSAEASASPLWMLTREPRLTALVEVLDSARRRLEAHPERPEEFRFSRKMVEGARADFRQMILRGEETLHRFCSLLCDSFLAGDYDLQSVVIGRMRQTGERFSITRNITQEDLYGHTDLDLGNRQLAKLRHRDGDEWQTASLVANFVGYHAREINRHQIHRLSSRIKAEEEIWNKVVDEIFALDELVQRDKQLRPMGRYVKDVFGLKIVVADIAAARRLERFLTDLAWPGPTLVRHGVPAVRSTRRVEILERKDYLGPQNCKTNGWSAIKYVARWWDRIFEIQVQPLHNYYREQERITLESHDTFKACREAVRDKVAESVPLFGFYRALLKWLFVEPGGPPPRYGQVTVVLAD